MQSIAVLQIGEAGIRMGNAGWEVLAREHELGYDGSKMNQQADEMIGAFFQERQAGSYSARSLQVDREEKVMEEVKNGHLAGLFREGTFAIAQQHIVDTSLEKLRVIAERADHLQGFMMIAGLGGNMGSMSAQIAQRVGMEYPKTQSVGFCLFPEGESSPRMEYLNAARAINTLTEHLDLGIAIEQSALTRICEKNLLIEQPTHTDRNLLFASLFSSVTATHRLQSSHSPDLMELMTSMVPFPKLNFLIPSLSPLSRMINCPQNLICPLTAAVFEPANCLAACDLKLGRFMAINLLFRGDVTPKDVSIALCRIKEKRTYKFVNWMPTGTRMGISYREGPKVGVIEECGRSVCLLSNSTAYLGVLERLKLGIGQRADEQVNEKLKELMNNYIQVETECEKEQFEAEQS